MDIRCGFCSQNYGSLGSGQQPRVLPCGDACCSRCLRSVGERSLYEFECIKCSTLIPKEGSFPLNKLYYEMQSYFKQHLKRREWDSPSLSKADDEPSRDALRSEEKCLNPFCVRARYQCDDVLELFCSKMCKQEHEELYQD